MTIIDIHVGTANRPSVSFRMQSTDSIQSRTIAWYLDSRSLPEPELIHLMARAIRPGDFVIDCGACTGFFSLLMGALGGVVLAIEPGENNLPELYANVGLNPFSIDVRPVALGNDIAEREFLLIEDGGANSFSQPDDRPPGELVKVSVRRLCDLVDRMPRLIKMDIEGTEIEALEGWLKSQFHHASHWCPYIVLEYNLDALARAGHNGEELRRLMRAHGYEMFALFPDGALPAMMPPNTQINCSRQNVNVLFSTPVDVGLLWPETTL